MAGKIFSVVRGSRCIPIVFFRRTRTDSVKIRPRMLELFNEQINAELSASYAYLAMANYFGRQLVAMPGCRAFYLEQTREEQHHATILIDFVSSRGGCVQLMDVRQPQPQQWENHLAAFRQSLQMEIDITQRLLDLLAECQNESDHFACNLIENEFLDHQIESVDQIRRYVTIIERMGCDGLAAQLFDHYLLSQHTQNDNQKHT